jgi:hypothetical protein
MFVSFREVATILIDEWKVTGNVGCETLPREFLLGPSFHMAS